MRAMLLSVMVFVIAACAGCAGVADARGSGSVEARGWDGDGNADYRVAPEVTTAAGGEGALPRPVTSVEAFRIDEDDARTGLDKIGEGFRLTMEHFARSHESEAWKEAFDADDLAAYAGAGALIAVAAAYDDEVDAEFGRSHPVGKARHLDDWLVVGVPAAAAVGLVLQPPSGEAGRYDDLGAFCETLLLTGATVGGLKLAADRDRPNGSGSDSFPSAHAALAFATARFVDKAYEDTQGWKVSVPAYAAATFIALSRVERRKHWASDAAAGAAIGFLIANVTSSLHYGEGGVNRRFEVAPMVTGDGVGIVGEVRF